MFFDKSLFESKYVDKDKRVPVDTLFLIGNGFDIWQGFHTGYSAFEKYYDEHIEEILHRLRLKKYTLCDDKGDVILDADGKEITYCDVELFYGDPHTPRKLPHEFWGNFETSLDKVDDQEINHYFGKTKEGLKNIQRCANNAQRILREAFSDWIRSIDIPENDAKYDFGENCLFVNFNYTDTLVKLFHVSAKNEFHIHGTASDKESIIFGHSTHPERPYKGLQMGADHPRYQGLYYVEEFLYNADKHVEDNFMKLKGFLGGQGVLPENIKHIYVLGLGFWDADLGYIRNLHHITNGTKPDPESDLSDDERLYLDSLDDFGMMHLNIEYAASHRERVMKRKPIPYPEFEAMDKYMYSIHDDPYYHIPRDSQMRLAAAAVRRRYLSEQEERDKKFIKEYLRMLRKKEQRGYISPQDAGFEIDETEKQNLSGAQWHISYFTPDDKKRIEAVMRSIGCTSYELYPSINECIKRYKV